MGIKRALLIGINYRNSYCPLSGCINDIKNVRTELRKRNYKSIITLIETRATKKNILQYLRYIKAKAQPGDTLYIHYSGHGSQITDKSGDEPDHKDETIVPYDFERHGMLMDDTIYDNFLKTVPKNVTVLMVMDCCNSGSVCDLKYSYNSEGKIINFPNYKDTKCDVIMISGCEDSQTSADAFIDNVYQGAMTFSFLYTVNNLQNNKISLKNIIDTMREILRTNDYTQIPQLSSGRELDLNRILNI